MISFLSLSIPIYIAFILSVSLSLSISLYFSLTLSFFLNQSLSTYLSALRFIKHQSLPSPLSPSSFISFSLSLNFHLRLSHLPLNFHLRCSHFLYPFVSFSLIYSHLTYGHSFSTAVTLRIYSAVYLELPISISLCN